MTKPDRPKVCSSLWRSVAWSRVSNAADMSSAVKIVIFPELVSLSRAVSVWSEICDRQAARGRNWEI